MNSTTAAVLPFGMCTLDTMTQGERGFKPFPESWTYDPVSQVSNLIFMGGTLVLSSFEERDSDTKSDSEDD